MAVLPTGIGPVTGGYQIERSLRFNSADSAYLNRTPASATNRQIWTWSAWFKRCNPGTRGFLFSAGTNSGTDIDGIEFNTDSLRAFSYNGSFVFDVGTNAVFRDPSAWYHIVVALDTTQATNTNRIKIYVNNVQQTFASATYPSQNANSDNINNTVAHYLGTGVLSNYGNGYLTEINFIDGQALTPSDFGETDSATGVWKPKAYSGTYGTNGFYLPFKTASQWSGYFDGTGDYLTVANNAALNFGTSAFTVECWFYRTSSAAVYGLWSLNSTTSGYAGARAQINTNGSIDVYISQNGSSWANSITNRGSTTVNTWNHLAVVRESNGDIKIYINGTQAGATVTNANSLYAGTSHLIGGVYSAGSPSSVFPGYISNLRSVVGTAVYTGTFTPPTAQLTAITNTQLLTCQSSTFVDNSINALTVTASGDSRPQQFSPFTLDVTDDHSGQGNNWQPNNLDLRTTGVGGDILVDSPTSYGTDTGVGGEVRGNYATLNPLDEPSTYAAAGSSANGNLDFSVSNDAAMGATFAVSSGKWYWEMTVVSGHSAGANTAWAAIASSTPSSVNKLPNQSGSGGRAYATTGSKFNENTSSSYGNTYTNGDVIGCALDLDNGKVYWSKNGTFQASGDPVAGTNAAFTGLTGTWLPVAFSNTPLTSFNFGQRAFAYTAPSGFKALCTTNLPTPTIGATSTTQANDYFNAVLYNGNGSNQSITSVGFQPDFVWVKSRSAAQNHGLYDAVRGVGRALQSNLTNAESNYFPYGVQSFDSSGFTVADDAGSSYAVNGSTGSPTYVAWNWNAGGSTVTNTSGTISAQVRANTTSGFSIVTYTGTGANATVGHGLGVAPGMVILKDRSSVNSWYVWHSSLTGSQCLLLNLTNAVASSSAFWNSTIPSSTVFNLGTDSGPNRSTGTYVAYCFAPVAGYSAFGSYTGNGSTDGPFVYTGFRPRYILLKGTDASVRRWCIVDTARSTYNTSGLRIYAELSNAEDVGGGSAYDIVSNGFKLRDADGNFNASGVTYIYAAFAESPFKYSLAR